MKPSKPSEWIEQETQKYIAKHDIRDPTLRLIAYIHPIMSLLDLLHSQGKIGIPDEEWPKDENGHDKFDLVEKACRFAILKHTNQKDDLGLPYIYHPQQVANILKIVYPEDASLIAAGWLHDTLEDTETTYEELVKEFGQDVADLVNEVTHDGQKDEYGFYFPRLHSKRGILLKFADRLSNISRMENWTPERQAHYLKKSKFWKDGSDLGIQF